MRNRVKTKVQPSLLLLLRRPFEEILPSRKVQVATLHDARLPERRKLVSVPPPASARLAVNRCAVRNCEEVDCLGSGIGAEPFLREATSQHVPESYLDHDQVPSAPEDQIGLSALSVCGSVIRPRWSPNIDSISASSDL